MRRTALLLALVGCVEGKITNGPAGTSDVGTNTTATTQVPYQGVYVLGNETLGTIDTASKPFVDGFVLRTAWTTLDTGTDGPQYDFSIVATAIADLQAMNKRLSLTIDAQLVPEYVFNAAHTTYITTVPGPGNTEEHIPTAVTWDPSTLAYYSAFMNSLANFQVCLVGASCAPSGKVALKDHPTLSGLRINIIGMGKLRQDSSNTTGTIFEVPGYDRTTFINAVIRNIHAAQDVFPKIVSWIPYFSVDDTASGTNQHVTLDEALIAAFTAEFNGSSSRRPVVGMFQELLRGDAPDSAGTNGVNLLSGRSQGSFVAFQACGGWAAGSLCNFAPGDNTPENGFDLGYGTYGAQYYEIYAGDLNTDSFAGMFLIWDGFLKAPTSTNNPVGLVAAPGAGRTNLLSWVDTSTIETGFVVERKTLPDGQWAVYGSTLPPNTTAYTDTMVGRNVSYSYRVHAVGAAGAFVLSNEQAVAGH